MPLNALTGSRVRERRLALGLRQADLARVAGISASYLNLIEHNRRRIAGEVLERLAAALGVETVALAEGAEGALAVGLRAAAGDEGAAELDRIEEFIGRFPGWAGVTAGLQRRVEGLERAVAALSDRIAHDPHLSLALHEVLSAVSSVRSTAAILAETEDIEPEWRARFHGNLHVDSERLARGAEALVAYLEGTEAEAPGGGAPEEEFDDWLAARGWHLAAAETGADAEPEIAALASTAARDLARAHLAQARDDAAAMPFEPFRAAMLRLGGDPLALAQAFGVPVLAAMRRLALLPGAPEGLVICDAAGALVLRKPAPGFQPPRLGAACALWPLFAALARPMSPITARIEMAGRNGRRFTARAWAEVSHAGGFDGIAVRHAAMLVLPESGAGAPPALRVGPTCRICPERDCPARREPSILTDMPALRG